MIDLPGWVHTKATYTQRYYYAYLTRAYPNRFIVHIIRCISKPAGTHTKVQTCTFHSLHLTASRATQMFSPGCGMIWWTCRNPIIYAHDITLCVCECIDVFVRNVCTATTRIRVIHAYYTVVYVVFVYMYIYDWRACNACAARARWDDERRRRRRWSLRYAARMGMFASAEWAYWVCVALLSIGVWCELWMRIVPALMFRTIRSEALLQHCNMSK